MKKIREISVSDVLDGKAEPFNDRVVVNFGRYSLYQIKKSNFCCMRCILFSLGVKKQIKIEKGDYTCPDFSSDDKSFFLHDNKLKKEIDIKEIVHPKCGCCKYEVTDFKKIENKINGLIYSQNHLTAGNPENPIYITETYYQNPINKNVEIAFGVGLSEEESIVKSRGEFIERYVICQPFKDKKADIEKHESIDCKCFYVPLYYRGMEEVTIVEDIFGRKKIIDISLVYMNFNNKHSFISSCGSSSYTNKKTAMEKAFLELVEKNDLMLSWTQDTDNMFILDYIESAKSNILKEYIEKFYNFKVYIYIHSNLIGVYTVEAIAINNNNETPYSFHASSADFSVSNAQDGALEELIGFIGTYFNHNHDKISYLNIPDSNFKYLYPENKDEILQRLKNIKTVFKTREHKTQKFSIVIEKLSTHGIDFYFKDFGDSIISFKGYYVYRCISPQLIPIVFGGEKQLFNKELKKRKKITVHPFV